MQIQVSEKKICIDERTCCFLEFAADKNIWKFFPTTELVPATACLQLGRKQHNGSETTTQTTILQTHHSCLLNISVTITSVILILKLYFKNLPSVCFIDLEQVEKVLSTWQRTSKFSCVLEFAHIVLKAGKFFSSLLNTENY